MKVTPVLEFYNSIMEAKTEEDIQMLNLEIKAAIISNILTDDRDIMTLNMALQIKSNYFLMKELMLTGGGTTIMVVGNPDDFDPEQMQLDEFAEQEYEDFKDGNIVSMKDFTKKKQ